jgi:hypothetical protein
MDKNFIDNNGGAFSVLIIIAVVFLCVVTYFIAGIFIPNNNCEASTPVYSGFDYDLYKECYSNALGIDKSHSNIGATLVALEIYRQEYKKKHKQE